MGSVEGHESRPLIPFGDNVLGVAMEVREGGVQLPDQVLVPVDDVLVLLLVFGGVSLIKGPVWLALGYALGRRQPTHLAPT